MATTDSILKLENAKHAIRITKASLDPAKAPRFDKASIEAERQKVSEGLDDALELLKLCQAYLLSQVA